MTTLEGRITKMFMLQIDTYNKPTIVFTHRLYLFCTDYFIASLVIQIQPSGQCWVCVAAMSNGRIDVDPMCIQCCVLSRNINMHKRVVGNGSTYRRLYMVYVTQKGIHLKLMSNYRDLWRDKPYKVITIHKKY